jgi:hypothetical protein
MKTDVTSFIASNLFNTNIGNSEEHVDYFSFCSHITQQKQDMNGSLIIIFNMFTVASCMSLTAPAPDADDARVTF